jgi:hypothetical protein
VTAQTKTGSSAAAPSSKQRKMVQNTTATEQWLNNSIPINMQKLNANTAPQMAHEQVMPMAAAIRNADTSVGFYNGQ